MTSVARVTDISHVCRFKTSDTIWWTEAWVDVWHCEMHNKINELLICHMSWGWYLVWFYLPCQDGKLYFFYWEKLSELLLVECEGRCLQDETITAGLQKGAWVHPHVVCKILFITKPQFIHNGSMASPFTSSLLSILAPFLSFHLLVLTQCS